MSEKHTEEQDVTNCQIQTTKWIIWKQGRWTHNAASASKVKWYSIKVVPIMLIHFFQGFCRWKARFEMNV